MIQPDAKCVVNGAKVNEAIMALNPLLAMSVGYIAGGKPPQVTYSDGEVKILLPLADSVAGFSLEELDIVDTNNAASSRYFMTSTGSVSTYGTTTASTSGTPTGKQSTAPTNKDRNSLGGTPNDKNRDKLTPAAGGVVNQGAAVAPANNIGAGGAVAGGGGGGGGGGGAVGGGARGGGGGGGSANMMTVPFGGQAPAPAPSAAPAPAPASSTSSTAPQAPTPTTATSSTEPAPTTATAPTSPTAPRRYSNTNVDISKLNDEQRSQIDALRVIHNKELEEKRREKKIQRIKARIEGIKNYLKNNGGNISPVTMSRKFDEIRSLEEELKNL